MTRENTKDYIAILDIGSNAVRLVVYDGLNRAPHKIYNERNICNLGKSLSSTGKLDPGGVKKAMDSIGRFAGLIAAMKIKTVHAVATAAIRDASDGKDFTAAVKKKFGIEIRVVDGDEEARLSALGVMMNGLGEGGLIGDYGGGSLELISVRGTKIADKKSLKIGSHRLQAIKGMEARIKAVDAALDSVPFLRKYRRADFYALGGAWRSMAKTHMNFSGHPLKVLDHYAIDAKKAAEYAGLLSHQSKRSLERTAGISKKRVEDMAVAALVMQRLFLRLQPARVIFSATGLREGLIYDALSPRLQRQDALIAGCRKMAPGLGRFDDPGTYDLLFKWLQPLFTEASPSFWRLLESACLLSDTEWLTQEDHRAEQAFQRILIAPFYGIDHAGRGFIAQTEYVRYAGGLPEGATADPAAVIAGLGLRAAYCLTGGALELLKYATLDVTPKRLSLHLKGPGRALDAEIVHAAMADLAAATGRKIQSLAMT